MNIILLTKEDLSCSMTDTASSFEVVLTDRRAEHICKVHKPELGQCLKVGLLDGLIGEGEVLALDAKLNKVHLKISLQFPPPAKLPLTVVLALPRPKMLRRIVQSLSTLGVAQLILVNSYRVEKSYWQTPFLDRLDDYVRLGLEQSVDTVPMQIQIEQRFKPFVEDRLEDMVNNRLALVAHPYDSPPCPIAVDEDLILAIGPEGGFITYEVEKLKSVGFTSVSLGARIQKVETVIPQLVGRLFS